MQILDRLIKTVIMYLSRVEETRAWARETQVACHMPAVRIKQCEREGQCPVVKRSSAHPPLSLTFLLPPFLPSIKTPGAGRETEWTCAAS